MKIEIKVFADRTAFVPRVVERGYLSRSAAGASLGSGIWSAGRRVGTLRVSRPRSRRGGRPAAGAGIRGRGGDFQRLNP